MATRYSTHHCNIPSSFLLRGRLLVDEHASGVGGEFLPELIDHPQESVLPARLPAMVPLLSVPYDLALFVRLNREKRVDGLFTSHPEVSQPYGQEMRARTLVGSPLGSR